MLLYYFIYPYNYKSSTTVIVTNMMGDDFKINLVGDNEIGSIGSYGDAWGGSINISGIRVVLIIPGT